MHASLPLSCLILLAGAAAFGARPAQAEVTGDTVLYRHGEVELEGYVARDTAGGGRRPAVLICHAWMGHGPFVRQVARDLAGRGYVAFALDVYGKGIRATNAQEAAALAGKYKGDRALLRARARAGLDALTARDDVDPQRVVAIGFCFGGTTALELARDGADLAGVVSFHGGLETPKPEETQAVKPQLLVLHGGDDPYVPPAELLGFWEEMKNARADYRIVLLANAVHSFSDPDAGSDPSRGAAYDETTANRAWKLAYDFFDEVLAR